MNLTTLASLAGVSVSTVSKAFSGSREVSEETRERIFEIAREHGCFDKYNKNRFDKRVIAVICPEIISEHYAAMTAALMNEIEARGALMTVSVTKFEEGREQELYIYYSSYVKADGIILLNPRSRITNTELVPTVAIGPAYECEWVDSIHTNYRQAISDAVSYLKSLGHERIGFAGEALTMSKLELFKSAMRQTGLPLDDRLIKVSSERFEKAGTAIAREWLAEGDAPSAIIAAYDYMAIGVIKAMRKEGYRIPEDISVVGMDDITLAPYLETSLSSIHIPNNEMCKSAVELIMKKIENQYFKARNTLVIPTQFIPRDSTGKRKPMSSDLNTKAFKKE